MVVDLASTDVDRLFAALSDATRRDIVVRVMREEESVSSLARRYAMSFAAVQKHVAVLERANLVTKHTSGRERRVSGNVEAVRAAAALLDEYEQIWRGRVDRIVGLLAEPAAPAAPVTPSRRGARTTDRTTDRSSTDRSTTQRGAHP